jgi:hypothetical protein
MSEWRVIEDIAQRPGASRERDEVPRGVIAVDCDTRSASEVFVRVSVSHLETLHRKLVTG